MNEKSVECIFGGTIQRYVRRVQHSTTIHSVNTQLSIQQYCIQLSNKHNNLRIYEYDVK